MITSINEFLTEIESLGETKNLFFRGHSSEEYELVPGIYREIKPHKKNLIEFEDQIFREVISKTPQEFNGKNTIETLALMQHYGVPTRVLDLTESALIALYFACEEEKNNKNGEVIIFNIPNESVCHFNSDKVAILSNLAKMQCDFQFNTGLVGVFREKQQELELKKLKYDIEELQGGLFNENISDFFIKSNEFISNQLAVYEFELDNFNEFYEKIENQFVEENGKLDEKEKKVFFNSFIESLQNNFQFAVNKALVNVNQSYFGKLLHNIREDKSYFDGIIDPDHISQVYAVRPKLDNPRIIRQQGAFLIFGIEQTYFVGFGDYKPMAKLSNDWILRGLPKTNRIIIDSESKSKIIEELETLGFNKSTLFPEVDKVADYIRNKYSNKIINH